MHIQCQGSGLETVYFGWLEAHSSVLHSNAQQHWLVSTSLDLSGQVFPMNLLSDLALEQPPQMLHVLLQIWSDIHAVKTSITQQ
jgi:hypothetical protein